MNLLAIILFIKNRNLRTRSMYLVISLTVADMWVGVLSGGYVQYNFLRRCRLIKLNLSREVGFSFFILFKFRFGAHPQRHCAAALRQRKLTVTLFITTLVSLLLWLPYIIYLLVWWSTNIFNSLSPSEDSRLSLSSLFLLLCQLPCKSHFIHNQDARL